MDNPGFTVLKSIRDELAATLTPEEFAALLSTQASDGLRAKKEEACGMLWQNPQPCRSGNEPIRMS